MDTNSFIAHIKTNYIDKDITEDVETRFDASNFELDRPFTKRKNEIVIGLMKDEIDGKTMTKLIGLRAKTYSYIINDAGDYKKAKVTKNCVVEKLKFKNQKNCFEAIQLDNKIKYLEKKININSLKKIIKNS